MSAAVSAPTATPKQTDPSTGYALAQQPIALAATSPILPDGSPLTAPGPGGLYVVDSATAKAGFIFGALIYRTTGGVVQIFDGTNWVAESSFNPASPALKPTAFAFDQHQNQWSATVLLSTLPDASQSTFPTSTGGSPKYGAIGVFSTPKTSPTTAIRSALGTPFGVAATNSGTVVQPGLLQGLTPTQDAKSADGFTVLVVEPSQLPAAQLIVSGSMGATGHQVSLQLFSAGVPRASVTLAPSGVVTVSSAMQITLDAPIVSVTGTLEAQNISYVPYGGSVSEFL